MLVTDEKLIYQIQMRRIKWAEALRNGGYIQGHTYLKAYVGRDVKQPEYCCLGIACEIFARDSGIKMRTVEPVITHAGRHPVEYDAGDSYFHSTFLPPMMRDWLGLSHKSEALLAKMNDSSVPFSVIANILEFLPVETGDEDNTKLF